MLAKVLTCQQCVECDTRRPLVSQRHGSYSTCTMMIDVRVYGVACRPPCKHVPQARLQHCVTSVQMQDNRYAQSEIDRLALNSTSFTVLVTGGIV